jgi:hypothetical protein
VKIETESYISYRTGVNDAFKETQFDQYGKTGSGIFIAAQNITFDNFSRDYYITIKLTACTRINLIFSLLCTIDKNDRVESSADFFSCFTHKSLSSVLKSINTKKGNWIIHANRNYPLTIRKISSNRFKISFIIDAPYMHPSWDLQGGIKKSTAFEIQKTGTEYICAFSLLWKASGDVFVPVMPMIYPNAHRAGFILTDHCDFDTAEKLRLFLYGNDNDGWMGKNLKITKGVFTLSSRSKDFTKNDSLEEKEYAKLIQKLYEDGSEIAPHALKSKGQLNAASFQVALQKISSCFHPQTWIDHGSYLNYCYSQGGKDNPEFMLIESLKKFNYTSLWSFHDVNTEALNSLNIFTSKKYSSLFMWKMIMQHMVKGKWLIAMHYFRSLWHRNYRQNQLFDAVMYAMASTKGAFSELKNKTRLFAATSIFFKSFRSYKKRDNDKPTLAYTNKDLLQYSEALFLEERRPLAQYKDGNILMFSTFETTHVKDIYNKQALDKLIKEYGLHIGHTYILNDLPYLNNIFTEKNGAKILSKEWVSFTNVLSEYVKDRKVWNPTMREFVNYLKSLLNINIKYTSSNTFQIKNNGDAAIKDFTLIIPVLYEKNISLNGNVIKPFKKDNLFDFFTFDISASATLNVAII